MGDVAAHFHDRIIFLKTLVSGFISELFCGFQFSCFISNLVWKSTLEFSAFVGVDIFLEWLWATTFEFCTNLIEAFKFGKRIYIKIFPFHSKNQNLQGKFWMKCRKSLTFEQSKEITWASVVSACVKHVNKNLLSCCDSDANKFCCAFSETH